MSYYRLAKAIPQLFSKCNVAAPHVVIKRTIALKKRFYRNVSIVENDGSYEIALDQRKLKTPFGKVFHAPQETLAHAVAAEWSAQDEFIRSSNMHLTTLCNRVVDIPIVDKEIPNEKYFLRNEFIEDILNYFESDTLLYRMSDPPELYELQNTLWNPVVQWACDRFKMELTPTSTIADVTVPAESRLMLQKHLHSIPPAALHGILLSVETLKSVLLTLACMERKLNVEDAVKLARLETQFQSDRWGEIAWSHTMEQLDTQARAAAAMLFVYSYLNTVKIVQKQKV